MNDFGGKLRQAREGRGMSVRQMATVTKISVATLEALERNDIAKLPGGIFGRSFVRSYAVEVGLDPDATVNDYLDRCQGEPPKPVPVVQIPEEELAFERRKRQAARVFLVALAAMIIVAAVVVYLILKHRPVTATPHELGTAVIPLTLRTS